MSSWELAFPKSGCPHSTAPDWGLELDGHQKSVARKWCPGVHIIALEQKSAVTSWSRVESRLTRVCFKCYLLKPPRGASSGWKDFSKEYRRQGGFLLILRKQMTLLFKSQGGSHSGNAILLCLLSFSFLLYSLVLLLVAVIKIWDTHTHTILKIFFISHNIIL